VPQISATARRRSRARGAPRREARANIETAGFSDRIEIRDQPVKALSDMETLDLA
jgi:hypothetical protein